MAIVYHGTNRLFDKFDLKYAMSGEGKQNYGKGIYFATNRDIAEEYAKATAKRYLFSPDDSRYFDTSCGLVLKSIDEATACVLQTINKEHGKYPVKDVIKGVAEYMSYGGTPYSIAHLVKNITSRYEDVCNWRRHRGYIYTVEIDDRIIGISQDAVAKAYVNRQDGACLVVRDMEAIKIIKVQKVEQRENIHLL